MWGQPGNMDCKFSFLTSLLSFLLSLGIFSLVFNPFNLGDILIVLLSYLKHEGLEHSSTFCLGVTRCVVLEPVVETFSVLCLSFSCLLLKGWPHLPPSLPSFLSSFLLLFSFLSSLFPSLPFYHNS